MVEQKDKTFVEQVLKKINTFKFGDGEQGARAIFNKFCEKHEALF